MKDKIKLHKKIRTIIVVFAAVILPALFRIIDKNSFELVRNIDVFLLFIVGFGTGALAVLLKIHFYLKKEISN